ncbi:unnamed protein product [Prorocentrum cordatum]|uniref:Uncharacterized protein n=1 Tax=Prorocentrum cordatum TaxID=2364126 RepID=A0ABN9WAM7_9DINO|nr:unnamed protein product [Polarella glacialis]
MQRKQRHGSQDHPKTNGSGRCIGTCCLISTVQNALTAFQDELDRSVPVPAPRGTPAHPRRRPTAASTASAQRFDGEGPASEPSTPGQAEDAPQADSAAHRAAVLSAPARAYCGKGRCSCPALAAQGEAEEEGSSGRSWRSRWRGGRRANRQKPIVHAGRAGAPVARRPSAQAGGCGIGPASAERAASQMLFALPGEGRDRRGKGN